MQFTEKKGIIASLLLGLLLAPTFPIMKIFEHLLEKKESYPLQISRETKIDYKNLDRYLTKMEVKGVIQKESLNQKGKKVKIKLTNKVVNELTAFNLIEPKTPQKVGFN